MISKLTLNKIKKLFLLKAGAVLTGPIKLSRSIATITATRTISSASAQEQYLNPSDSDEDVQFDATAEASETFFYIHNTGSTYNLVIKDSNADPIGNNIAPGVGITYTSVNGVMIIG